MKKRKRKRRKKTKKVIRMTNRQTQGWTERQKVLKK